MDYPEICDKHEFNDVRTRINHTTNTKTVEIYNWSFFTNKKQTNKQVNPESEFERVSLCYVHVQIQLMAGRLEPKPPDFKNQNLNSLQERN